MKALNILIIFFIFLSCKEKVEKTIPQAQPNGYYTTLDINKYKKEVLEFDSTFINGNVPLITSKAALNKIFGRPDKVYPVIPGIGTYLYLGAEEEEKPYYLVFGKSVFESVGNKVIVNTIDFESTNIKLVNPKIILSKNTTAIEVQKTFVESGRIIYYTNGNSGHGYMILKTYLPNGSDGIWFLTFSNSYLTKIILYRVPHY